MRKKIVAIVGRPNVGKSTLFNRLIGERSAIEYAEPGVTRDRHYGECNWAGREFIVIDTGGYVPRSDDQFELAIREQVAMSVEEADIVLFLVDGRDGLTPMDEEIARMLRKHARRVLLAVNKIDSEKNEIDQAQFYQLGLGDPLSVSAISGRKTGDLLDDLTADFESAEEEEESELIHVAVIGRPNVGKSSFVNALLGKNRSIVTDVPGTTRDAVDSLLHFQERNVLLIDTAGLRRRSKVEENIEFFSTLRTLKSIQRCDVALCLIEADTGITHQDLDIISEAVHYNKGVVLGVNKWDLIEKDSNTIKALQDYIEEKLPVYTWIPIVTISAINKQRTQKALEVCIQVYEERNKRIETSELNELLFELLRTTPPPSTPTGREVKFYYAAQVRESPPVIVLFVNEPKYIPESYRRFAEKQVRKAFGFIGVPLTLQFRQK